MQSLGFKVNTFPTTYYFHGKHIFGEISLINISTMGWLVRGFEFFKLKLCFRASLNKTWFINLNF